MVIEKLKSPFSPEALRGMAEDRIHAEYAGILETMDSFWLSLDSIILEEIEHRKGRLAHSLERPDRRTRHEEREKRVYSPEELLSDYELGRNKTESWKKMRPSVRGTDTMPDHYFVSYYDESVGYYAMIIEDLTLIPREQNTVLDLTRCVTFPGGKQIPTQFQGLVCTEASMPVTTTYKTAWVIGKANLIDPYAVKLLPP